MKNMYLQPEINFVVIRCKKCILDTSIGYSRGENIDEEKNYYDWDWE